MTFTETAEILIIKGDATCVKEAGFACVHCRLKQARKAQMREDLQVFLYTLKSLGELDENPTIIQDECIEDIVQALKVLEATP